MPVTQRQTQYGEQKLPLALHREARRSLLFSRLGIFRCQLSLSAAQEPGQGGGKPDTQRAPFCQQESPPRPSRLLNHQHEQLGPLQKFLLPPSQILETEDICPDGGSSSPLPSHASVCLRMTCEFPNTQSVAHACRARGSVAPWAGARPSPREDRVNRVCHLPARRAKRPHSSPRVSFPDALQAATVSVISTHTRLARWAPS